MKVDLKNCYLFIRRHSKHNTVPADGETGDYVIVKFGDGNFTWNVKRNYQYELDRGHLDDVREGDEEPMDVSFGGKYEWIQSVAVTGDTDPTRAAYKNQLSLAEALRGRMFDQVTEHPWIGIEDNGNYDKSMIERETWLSADAAQGACSPYCVQLELHNDLRLQCPDLDAPGEAMLFRYFRAEQVNVDAKAGTINVSGRCNLLRPLIMNPYPVTSSSTPKWLYANGEPGQTVGVPRPFVRGESDDPQSGTWPRDRRDPSYVSA